MYFPQILMIAFEAALKVQLSLSNQIDQQMAIQGVENDSAFRSRKIKLQRHFHCVAMSEALLGLIPIIIYNFLQRVFAMSQRAS